MFTVPRAASQHFNRKKLGANIAIHHNRVNPNFRVYLSFGVTARVVRGVNEETVDTQPGDKTWNFYRGRLISSFHGVRLNLVSL